MTSIRVLLVEDEADIRTLLAELLRHDGYEVIEAADGDQAVALIDGPDGFDLLLTDVQMPGLIDGIQVATYARQRYPHLPVIVVSAQPSNAQRLRRLVSRSVFIGKPYRLNTLLETMRRMLAEPAPDPAHVLVHSHPQLMPQRHRCYGTRASLDVNGAV